VVGSDSDLPVEPAGVAGIDLKLGVEIGQGRNAIGLLGKVQATSLQIELEIAVGEVPGLVDLSRWQSDGARERDTVEEGQDTHDESDVVIGIE
jgi:hypothetical protein